MKKTHPIIFFIRLIFAVTCVSSLTRGIWIGISEQVIAGTYFMTALAAAVSLLITHAPDFATHKDALMMPTAIQVGFSLFTFCAMFLGEIMNFYEIFHWWDLMLHSVSGVMFSMVGLMLFTSLNRKKEVRNQLNPITIVLFAVCFSVACGVVWEIFEYAADSLLGMNMQRWQTTMSAQEWSALQNMSNASNPGLMNTMMDIIADTLGSLLSIALVLPVAKYNCKYEKEDIPSDELLEEWEGAYAAVMTPKAPRNVPVPAELRQLAKNIQTSQDEIENGGYEVA